MRKFNIWNSYTRYFLWFFVGSLIATVLTSLIGGAIFALLHDISPDAFPKYSPVLNREEYEAQQVLFSTLGALFAVPIITYITMRNDNTRYERMITKTDGMYRIAEGAKIYFKTFLIHDILAALIIPALHFALTLIPFPDGTPELVYILTYQPRAAIEGLGFATALILTLLLSLASRFIALPLCLEAYRSRWLSDID